ncbi:MAG: transglycosylase domain-containing protein [Akkermansiaceae bacterium]
MPAKKTTRTSPRKTARKSTTKGTAAKSSPPSTPPRNPRAKIKFGAQHAVTKKNAKKRAKKKNSFKVGNIFTGFFLFIWKTITFPFRVTHNKTKRWSTFPKWAARITFPPLILGLIFFTILWSIYSSRASIIFDKELVAKMPSRSTILDRNGEPVGHLHGDNRFLAKYENVSDHFIKALIAREDARFYQHSGVDLRGLARSAKVLILEGSRQGGSTLSMQLAENSFRYDGKSIDGKFLEMALAKKIEANFSKKQILEMYMNRIFWGGSIKGIESASRNYFEKSASELTLSESAMLAGIISAPNAFTPFRHYDRAIKKRDITLRSMVQYDLITQAEADAAMKEDIHIRPPERRMNKKSYVMSTLERELDIILEKNNIKMGGLTIKTTLDFELQKNAERALQDHLRTIERKPSYFQLHQTHSQYSNIQHNNRSDPQYVQGALVCIENHTGGIVSIVGGRNPYHSEYNRATHAKRQIGSIFKPFVYLAAFDKGMSPHQYISDDRIYRGEINGADPNWHPKNSDNTYRGSIRISEALAQSRNTPAIRVGNVAGLNTVIHTAQQAGFKQDIPHQPSIYLGAFAATPIEVATAYTAFPNDCIVYRPYLINEILDKDGNTVYKGSGIMGWDNHASKSASRAVSNILEQVTNSGTASRLRSTYGFRKPAAGKTGTTNDSRDGWFAGYTSRLTCAVWVGMDDNSTVYRGATGASLALPIWADYMKKADSRYPAGSIKNRAIIVEPNSANSPPRAIIVE